MVSGEEQDMNIFMEFIANSLIKKELILLFHTDACMDNCYGISLRLHRRPQDIQPELDALVQAKVLGKVGEGEEAVYYYDPAPELKPLIQKFVASHRSVRELVQEELRRMQAEIEKTRRESLREVRLERSKLKTIISSMAEGVLVTDEKDEVVLFNPAASVMFGWSEGGQDSLPRHPPVGRHVSEVFNAPPLKELTEAIRKVRESGERFVSRQFTITEPRSSALMASIAPVQGEEGEVLGVVTVFQDVSHLQELERIKTDFSSMLVHELRSPLTAIKGFALSALRGVFGKLNPRQVEALEIIDEQSQRLIDLINGLMDLAKIEAGRIELELEPADLREVVNAAIRLLRQQVQEKGIELSTDMPAEPVTTAVDRMQMERVFINLISNAIKYTEAGGRVMVSAREYADYVQVSVSDTGIGIPTEDLDRIFDKFYRVKDRRTRTTTGTGLGLPIAKGIVEAHLGRIDVDSEPDKGSTFIVTLPKRKISDSR